MIDADHVKDICKPGTLEACSYLAIGSSGWECLKFAKSRKHIDERRKNGTMRAMSNNCDGLMGDGSEPTEEVKEKFEKNEEMN